LKNDYSPSEALEDEICSFVKARLSTYAYPWKIELVEELPLTNTAKIVRKDLRAREYEGKTDDY